MVIGIDIGWCGMIGSRINMHMVATIEKWTGAGGGGWSALHTHQVIRSRTQIGKQRHSSRLGILGSFVILLR